MGKLADQFRPRIAYKTDCCRAKSWAHMCPVNCRVGEQISRRKGKLSGKQSMDRYLQDVT